tara:strand:+ start:4634 stop:5146 length:513 start_codon:yes stop_codon:yes gene_type:complete
LNYEYLHSKSTQSISSFYNISAIDINGNEIKMEKFKNKKILIVNVASKCGYTPQYIGLQKIHEEYGKDLVVLGFPSNDFFWQEPGTNEEIKMFCKRNYGVTFQIFEKVHVKGSKQHPLYKWLSNKELNGWNNQSPSWNFYKYLIDEKGNLIKYFKSDIDPSDSLITKYLN